VQDIKTLFTHRSVYVLPDGTHIVALWVEFVEQPRWWFVEQLPDGRLGNLTVTVMPNGSVWNYRLEPDALYPEVCVPYPSDLTIADFRKANAPSHNRVPRIGNILVALLSLDALWCSLVDTAAIWQMTG
jgi:hypothetical protein